MLVLLRAAARNTSTRSPRSDAEFAKLDSRDVPTVVLDPIAVDPVVLIPAGIVPAMPSLTKSTVLRPSRIDPRYWHTCRARP